MKPFPRPLLAPLVTALAIALLLPLPAQAAKRKTTKQKDDRSDVKVEEVGILKNEDVRVVQKMLYVKKGYHELGFMLTTQPWDSYAAGAMLGFDLTLNPSENLGVEIAVQGGYAWGNGHFRDLNHLGTNIRGELTGVASDGVRQLVGGSLNLVWSPIYAKLAWGRRKVVHFDVYGTLGLHGFLAQQLTADKRLKGIVGPSLGIGLKFFLSPKVALKVDLRDHISLGARSYTHKFAVRNNFQFGLGFAFYAGRNR